MAEEACRRPAMSEEVALRQRKAHAPSCAGAWGTGQFYTGRACDSHAPFLATGLGGWDRRRSAHLPMGAVLSHALPNMVFQKTHLLPLGFFEIPSTKFAFFWQIRALSSDTM